MGSATIDNIRKVTIRVVKTTGAAAFKLGSRCHVCESDFSDDQSTETYNIPRSCPPDNSRSFCTYDAGDEAENTYDKSTQPRVLKFDSDDDTYTTFENNEETPPPEGKKKQLNLSKSKNALPQVMQGLNMNDEGRHGTFSGSSFDDTFGDESTFLPTSQSEFTYDDNTFTDDNNTYTDDNNIYTDDDDMHTDDNDDEYNFDSIGKNIIGIVTDVVTSKSNWTSDFNDVSKSTSGDGNDLERNQNSRDDESIGKNDSVKYGKTISIEAPGGGGGDESMGREFPSFGKSREFRSFGSNGSKEKRSETQQSSIETFKPTFITPDQDKVMEKENSRYTFISKRTDSSSTEQSAVHQSASESSTFEINEHYANLTEDGLELNNHYVTLTKNGEAIISGLSVASNDDPRQDTSITPLLQDETGSTTIIEYSSLSKTPTVVSTTTSASSQKSSFYAKKVLKSIKGKRIAFFKKPYDHVAD